MARGENTTERPSRTRTARSAVQPTAATAVLDMEDAGAEEEVIEQFPEDVSGAYEHLHAGPTGEVIPELNYKMVTSAAHLRRVISELEQVSEFGFDIETASTFNDFGERHGSIRLIQIGIDDPQLGRRQWVIDCWEVNPAPLVPILQDPKIRKIIHNAQFEARWFEYHLGTRIANSFDTLIAWRRIHTRRKVLDKDYVPAHNNKLGTICNVLFGVELDKSEQASMWSRRQLTKSQRDYAALDAAVMIPTMRETISILQQEGLLHEVEAASEDVYASVQASIAAGRKKREGRFSDAYRVTSALHRCQSLADLETVWEQSRQVSMHFEEREAARKVYAKVRKALRKSRPTEVAEDVDVNW